MTYEKMRTMKNEGMSHRLQNNLRVCCQKKPTATVPGSTTLSFKPDNRIRALGHNCALGSRYTTVSFSSSGELLYSRALQAHWLCGLPCAKQAVETGLEARRHRSTFRPVQGFPPLSPSPPPLYSIPSPCSSV